MIHVDFLPQTHTCIHTIIYTSICYTRMSAKRNKHIQTHTHIYIIIYIHVHIYIVHGSCLLHDHPQLISVSYLRPPKPSNGALLRPGVQNGETARPREEGDIMHSKADQIQGPQHGTGCNDQCSWLQHGAQMVMGGLVHGEIPLTWMIWRYPYFRNHHL